MKEILLSFGFILFVIIGTIFIYSLCAIASRSDYYLEDEDDKINLSS